MNGLLFIIGLILLAMIASGQAARAPPGVRTGHATAFHLPIDEVCNNCPWVQFCNECGE